MKEKMSQEKFYPAGGVDKAKDEVLAKRKKSKNTKEDKKEDDKKDDKK